MSKKILIIGSKGFIGSKILKYYQCQKTMDVWGADVVRDYPAKNYFLIDASNSHCEFIFQEQNFDVCINCAGAASVSDSFINPGRDYHLNTKMVYDILEAIRKFCPECKFLNFSSAAVYGSPQQLPVNESDNVNPLSPYGWHKYQSELVCKEFYELFNVQTCSARIFSAFGPGLKKQIFWDWCKKINDDSNLPIYGTGHESRDFIFIDDLVQAIAHIVEDAAFKADIINVANGIEVSIKSAIEVFKQKCPIPFSYSFSGEARKGNPLNWCADIKVLSSLGYRQKVSFESGIEKYIEWITNEK